MSVQVPVAPPKTTEVRAPGAHAHGFCVGMSESSGAIPAASIIRLAAALPGVRSRGRDMPPAPGRATVREFAATNSGKMAGSTDMDSRRMLDVWTPGRIANPPIFHGNCSA